MSTKQVSIDGVWKRLKSHEGMEFETKTGKPFTFEISGDIFNPSRTKYNITKDDFRKAMTLVPIDGPGVINDIIHGPAYVRAVLHDRRIRMQDW